MNAPPARPARRQSEPRSLGIVPRARQGHHPHRPRRTRPGRAHRHGADRRRRTRRGDGAHRHPLRRHRTARRTRATPPAASRFNSAASPCGRPAPTCARCFSTRRPKSSAARPAELSIRDGSILRNGAPTGQDYWTLAGAVNLAVKATGSGPRKPVADMKHIGAQQRAPRPAGQDFRQGRLHPRHAASTAWCMRAWCASPTAAPPSIRSTSRRSSAPPRRRSNSCATAISSPSSAMTRPPSIWRAPPRSMP